MKVNLYLQIQHTEFDMVISTERGPLLARADLEVVPGGTYVIDGKAYTLAGKPTFHIQKLPALYENESRSHHLAEVDLEVVPV